MLKCMNLDVKEILDFVMNQVKICEEHKNKFINFKKLKKKIVFGPFTGYC